MDTCWYNIQKLYGLVRYYSFVWNPFRKYLFFKIKLTSSLSALGVVMVAVDVSVVAGAGAFD